MRHLFAQWTQGFDHSKYALASLTGRVANLREKRLAKIEWAEMMIKPLMSARVELGNDAGPVRLSRWLNEHHHRTQRGNRFHGSNLGELFGIDREIIEDAVLECRTRMSALALSAKFEMDHTKIHPLELECVEEAKRAILLVRRLERLSEMSESDLAKEAVAKVCREAIKQRETYLPMLARDCYLTMAEFDEVVPSIERLYLSKIEQRVVK